MALLPFTFFYLFFFLFFFPSSLFRPRPFFFSPPRFLFLGFIKAQFRNENTRRISNTPSFLVFNGAMENRFGSDAIAANLFQRAAFTIARVSHSWQNSWKTVPRYVDRATFCHGFVDTIRLYSCRIYRKETGTHRFNCIFLFYIYISKETICREWLHGVRSGRDTEITRHRFAV